MAKYGGFLYGTAKYGTAPRLNYSVEPMEIIVLDFSRVYIGWQSPTGNFTKIRLVRNQIGYASYAEDGIVIWSNTPTQPEPVLIDVPKVASKALTSS